MATDFDFSKNCQDLVFFAPPGKLDFWLENVSLPSFFYTSKVHLQLTFYYSYECLADLADTRMTACPTFRQ